MKPRAFLALTILLALIMAFQTVRGLSYGSIMVATNMPVAFQICFASTSPANCFTVSSANSVLGTGVSINYAPGFAYLVMPPLITLGNGTLRGFLGWYPISSSILFSANTTLAVNQNTNLPSNNLIAVYGSSITMPMPCADPLRLGWTGGTVGCFFGISNIYLVLLIGIPLVVVIPIAATMKPKRASK